MKYRKGYKYQLAEDDCFQTNIYPKEDIHTRFITLMKTGMCHILTGYASDGPSGPTLDYPKEHVMRGAFFHDALCQLLRMGELPQNESIIIKVHAMAYILWLNSGMWPWRAKIWWKSLEKFADFAVDPANKKKVYEVI